MSVRRALFLDGLPDSTGRFHHSMLDRKRVLAIRNQYSLGDFIALLCLARKGEALEDDPAQYLRSACAFDIFPRVLYAHQPLRYRWKGLFDCLDRIFWKRIYTNGAYFEFPVDTVQSGLNALSVDYSAELLHMSGMTRAVSVT